MTRVIEVIETDDLRGDGDKEPFRRVYQIWTKEGKLMFEDDPIKKEDV